MPEFVIRGLLGLTALLLPCAMLPAHAEVGLKAITSLSKTLTNTQSFLTNFVAVVNKEGKGSVKITYMGGPEVTPPRNAGAALRRGVVDMLHGPSSYYQGMVPEASVLVASNRKVQDVRAGGGLALLNKIWNKKLNAQILAWGESGTQMNFYLTEEPKIGERGPDLRTFRIRSSATYRALINALGGTPVGMKASEIYTGLQRGVISGFGWPNADVLALGVAGIVKYRLQPAFYRVNSLVIVNLDKWKSLPKATQDLLNRVAVAYEQTSVAFMAKASAKDTDALLKRGMKILVLKKPVARRFLDTAYDLHWRHIAKTTPDEVASLRAAFYEKRGN